jgi:hypothetical protein
MLRKIISNNKLKIMDNIDDLTDRTPEEIAEIIFTHEPKSQNSHQILALQQGADLTYVFEILLQILLNGMEVLTNGIDTIDLTHFTIDHIKCLNPWFRSLGFNIIVTHYNLCDQDEYKEYYCKIILKNFGTAPMFIAKGIEKNFHFLLNGLYYELNKNKTNLEDLYAVLKNNQDIYKIYFNFCAFTPVGKETMARQTIHDVYI